MDLGRAEWDFSGVRRMFYKLICVHVTGLGVSVCMLTSVCKIYAFHVSYNRVKGKEGDTFLEHLCSTKRKKSVD